MLIGIIARLLGRFGRTGSTGARRERRPRGEIGKLSPHLLCDIGWPPRD